MGFDAIWISPITKNIEQSTAYGEAYHGYWQQDIYSINSHFGTAEDLKALAKALHYRGMVCGQLNYTKHVSADGMGLLVS